MPASARSTSSSNRAWRASRRRRTAARSAAGIPRRRLGMALVSYGDMERTNGLPLDGPGLGALDLEIDARRAGATADRAGATDDRAGATADRARATDEPAGYLVAMDGGVRIHFLDWGGPAS